MCPECRREATRERRKASHEANRDYRLARQAEWRRVNAERKLQADAAYREANRASINAQKREYYERNRDAVIARTAEHKRKHPEAYREYVRQRKAKLTAAFVAPVDDDLIYERDGGICQLCGELVDRSLKYPDLMSLTIDHIIPLVAGGTHEPDNAQLAHMQCNSRKQASVAS